jgi:hypothetical protein
MKHILLLMLLILNGSQAVGAGYVQRAWNYAKSFFVAEPEQLIQAPTPQQGTQPFEPTGDLWIDKYRLLEDYKRIEPNVPQDQAGKTAYLQRAEAWVQKTYPHAYASLTQEKTTQMMQAHYGKKIQVPSNLMLFYYEDLEKPARTTPITLENNINRNLQTFTKNIQAINTIQEFKDSVENLMSSLDAAQKLIDQWVPKKDINRSSWKDYLNTITVFRNTLNKSQGYIIDEPYREIEEFKSLRNDFYQKAKPYLEQKTKFSSYWAELRSLLRKLYYHVLFITTYNNGIREFSEALTLLKTIAQQDIADFSHLTKQSQQLEKSLSEALNIFERAQSFSETKENEQQIITREYDKDIKTIIKIITYFKRVIPLIVENKKSNEGLEIIFNDIKRKKYTVKDQTTLELFNEYKDHLCTFIQQIHTLNTKKPKAPTLIPQEKPKEEPATPEERKKEQKYRAIQEKVAQLKKDPRWHEHIAQIRREAEEYRKHGEQVPTIVAQPTQKSKTKQAAPTAHLLSKQHSQLNTLNDWESARTKLPTYRSNPPKTDSSNAPLAYPYTILSKQEFLRILDEYLATREKQLKNATWLQKMDPALYDLNDSHFRPFAQRLTLENGSKAILLGDLHGDFHSFMTYILNLRKEGFIDNNLQLKKDIYLIFLGDYVDRGLYGAEVMALIMSLYSKNPEQVIPVRGNHEDFTMIESYGFKQELLEKFGDDKDMRFKVYKVYDLLPNVLLLGSGNKKHGYWYAECAHGSFELGHDLHELLNDTVIKKPSNVYTAIKEIDREKTLTTLMSSFKITPPLFTQALMKFSQSTYEGYPLKKISFEKNDTINTPSQILFGYQWGDYYFNQPKDTFFDFKEGRGPEWGKEITKMKFNLDSRGGNNKVVGMFRAHQHSSSTIRVLVNHGGLYQHFSHKQWDKTKNKPFTLEDGFVITFNLSPDSIYGSYMSKFTQMTMGILTIDEDFNKTTLQPVEIFVPK